MPLLRAVPVVLSAGERTTLKKRVRGAKTAYRDRLRAQIVLAAARGRDNARIAADLRHHHGHRAQVAGPVRRPRPGWAGGSAPVRAAAADQRADPGRGRRAGLPAARRDRGAAVALDRAGTAAEITKAGLGRQLSVSSVLRILAEHPVKPWQYQSWISPRAPDFAARASVILDLYQGFYQGRRLRPGDRILSVDAKPSIQARGRCRPTTPASRGKPVRAEHEYVRHGALALLAALDVHTGKVFAATPATTGITPFMDLMGQVMSLPEYKDAPRVFVIVDNGSDHRGQAAVRRLHDAWPNAIMIHTPVHASWLNQAEIFFSITQKKAISPNDFASLDELARTLLAFVDRYNQTARPFNWKFTAADLARLLDRISAREHAARKPAELPEAA